MSKTPRTSALKQSKRLFDIFNNHKMTKVIAHKAARAMFTIHKGKIYICYHVNNTTWSTNLPIMKLSLLKSLRIKNIDDLKIKFPYDHIGLMTHYSVEINGKLITLFNTSRVTEVDSLNRVQEIILTIISNFEHDSEEHKMYSLNQKIDSMSDDEYKSARLYAKSVRRILNDEVTKCIDTQYKSIQNIANNIKFDDDIKMHVFHAIHFNKETHDVVSVQFGTHEGKISLQVIFPKIVCL